MGSRVCWGPTVLHGPDITNSLSLFLSGKWVYLKARVDNLFVFRVGYGVLTAPDCVYMKCEHSHAFLYINTEGKGLEIIIKMKKLIFLITVTIAVQTKLSQILMPLPCLVRRYRLSHAFGQFYIAKQKRFSGKMKIKQQAFKKKEKKKNDKYPKQQTATKQQNEKTEKKKQSDDYNWTFALGRFFGRE